MSAKPNVIVPPLHSNTELANQIERIVHSEAFAGSEILRKLLLYLSSRSMETRIEPVRVKEIAADVFGRSKDFDSQSDSVVRVHTSRLRSKLAEYYMDEGAEDDLIVTIPKGGYTLAYHFRQVSPPVTPVLQDSVEFREPAPEHGRLGISFSEPQLARSTISLSLVVILVLSAIALGWFASSAVRAGLERDKVPPVLRTFWQDFTARAETPLIVFSNFRLIGSLEDGLATYTGADDPSKPIIDTYTTTGEVTGVFEVSRLLQQMGKSATVKRGRLLTWDEAKDQNLVFVGGPLAETPLRDVPILKEFRFNLGNLPNGRRAGAIVNVHPKQGELPVYFASDSLYAKADIHTSKMDYAIIALRGAPTHNHRIMILAGISEYGTEGAAEFVTRETSVKDLLARLHVRSDQVMPLFETLLRIRVEGGVPVESEVVSVHIAN